MMSIVRQSKFSTQFIIIALAAIIAVVCVGWVNAIALKQSMLSERQEMTKNAVQVAHKTIDVEANRALAQGLDIETAQQRAIDLIRALRYGDNEYFFMIDNRATGVMHPIKPELDGKDLSAVADPYGKRLFQAFVDTVTKDQSGYVDYYWAKPGFDNPVAKISFVQGYEPWGWIIGTGLYLDDIDAMYWQQMYVLLAIIAVFSLILVLFLILVVRNAKNATRDIVAQLNHIEQEDCVEPLSLNNAAFEKNEFGEIMKALSSAQNAQLLRVEEAQNKATAHIKQALDSAGSPILLAGVDGKVTYANQAANALFHDINTFYSKGSTPSATGRRELTDMTLGELHPKQFSHNGSKTGFDEEVKLGMHYVKIVCTPVVSQSGDQTPSGYVVEWEDITEYRKKQALSDSEAQSAKEQAEAVQRRLDLVLANVDAAAAGDLSESISVTGEDMVGVIATSLNRFLLRTRENMGTIGGHAHTMIDIVSHLSTASNELEHNAVSTSSQVSTASAGAESISHAVDTVAAATEQMSASIKEIASNVANVSKVAEKAVELSTTTDQSMRQLADSSSQIGQVIRVITSIAEQTNLLALNATIEAARAGDAGKGFAVVASEVKELAKETARATETIERMIASIQDDTEHAVEAISEISSTVGEINSIQVSVASAIEQQMSTTQEISRSVQSAAVGCSDVANNVNLAANTATSTREAVTRSVEGVASLTKMVEEMQELVDYYKVK